MKARNQVRSQRSGRPLTIAVDFDGTLATGTWPDINDSSEWNQVVAGWLRKRMLMGDRIVLWTCRENYGGRDYEDREYLNLAVQYCTRHQMFFDAVNRNIGETPGEFLAGSGRFGRKICADVYLDDHSVPFRVNSTFSWLWWKIYLWLMDRKLEKVASAAKNTQI